VNVAVAFGAMVPPVLQLIVPVPLTGGVMQVQPAGTPID